MNVFVARSEYWHLFTTQEQADAKAEWLNNRQPRHIVSVFEYPIDLPLEEWESTHVFMARDGHAVNVRTWDTTHIFPPCIKKDYVSIFHGEPSYLGLVLRNIVRTSSHEQAIKATNELRCAIIAKGIPWVEGPLPELL